MGKKYKGVATIELTNVKTGEVTTQVEENIVTNAIANIVTNNPFGCVNFTRYTNIAKYMTGVMLFDKTINENVNNTMIPFMPTAWAGDVTNTGSATRRGNINNPASFVTNTGCQLTWEWNTSQGNGTYKCIALTTPIICDTDNWGAVPLGGVIGTHRAAGGNYKVGYNNYPDSFHDNCCGTTVVIDDKRGYYYKLYIPANGKTVEIVRVTRHCHKIPVGQTNEWDASTYELNKAMHGELYKDRRAIVKTLDTSITYGQTNYTSGNMVSISYHDNTMYLFSLKNGTNTVIVTKIDLSQDFIDSNVTVTQETITFQGMVYNSATGGSNQGTTQMKDSVCFKYPYLYLANNVNRTQLYKCNINDSTDITLLDSTENTVSIGAVREGVILGNFYVNNAGYAISLSEDKVFTHVVNALEANSTYQSVNTIGNEYFRTARPGTDSSTAEKRSELVMVNPYYLATINNVTPFTKTSDHTLKITYIITEVDS